MNACILATCVISIQTLYNVYRAISKLHTVSLVLELHIELVNVFNSNKVGIIQLSNLIIKTGDFETSEGK